MAIAAGIVILLGLGIGIYRYNFQEKKYAMLEITTGNRQKKKIILPDETSVWLNSNSTLIYPEKFDENSRKIKFTGEAYFEVARNEEKTFTISAKNTITQVLGTSFNLKARNQEDEVVVNGSSGKVALCHSKIQNKKVFLEKGTKGIYCKSKKSLTKQFNKDLNFLLWKTNILVFRNSYLEDVCLDLSKHFGKDITIADKRLSKRTLSVEFNNKTLKESIPIIEFTLKVKAVRQNGKIQIKQ